MANIKSQKKRALTNLKSHSANLDLKSQLKSAIKVVIKNCEEKNVEEAKAAFNKANSLLDKAVSSGIKHKNYAARQKARLQNLINNI